MWLDYQKIFGQYTILVDYQGFTVIQSPTTTSECYCIPDQDLVHPFTSQGVKMSKLSQKAFTTTNGTFQSDSLLMLLFTLSLNPLSYQLTKHSSHRNKCRSTSHIFFGNNLKLYEPNINHIKYNLNL